MLITEAHRGGETPLAEPFDNAMVVHTTLLGALLWGEYPDVWIFVGTAILVVAGLYIWRREVARIHNPA